MSREAHVRICERLGVCLTPVDSTAHRVSAKIIDQ
jgi:hypothetical protein